jgi:hypothetical protein
VAGQLSAELWLTFDWQSSDEGRYYNRYLLSLMNTGDVPIFALFICPQSPYSTGGTTDEYDDDPWDGWSAASYREDGPHPWYMLNSGDQYITALDDVPNTPGWASYNEYLGIFWNNTHDPLTHATDDPLGPMQNLADFTGYTIYGVEEGQTEAPPLVWMVAGYDANTGQVLTSVYGLPEAIPGDFNGDGLVNTEDINPFILALTDPGGYALQYGQSPSAYDLTGDGLINTEDINAFIAALTGGAGPQISLIWPGGSLNPPAIPEPSTAAILLVAVSALRRRPAAA